MVYALATQSSIHTTATAEFWHGVCDELPLMLAVVPFGMVFGVLGLASGLAPIEVILLSSIVFAGASQVVFVQMWGAATPGFLVGGSVAVINLRHALYSASVAKYLQHLPLRWRLLLAYLLTDEAYALSIQRFQQGPPSPNQHYHLLGSGLTLWSCWQIATIIGVFAGAMIPDSWSLDFAIPLTFIALVAPAIKNRADLAACATSATVALAGQGLPWQSWILTAAVAGILAGWLVQRHTKGAA